MRRSGVSVLRPILAALVLWSARCSALAAGGGLHTYHSRFYEIHTKLGRKQVIEFTRHMDAMFALYRRRFSGFRSRRVGDMPLYLLRTHEDYLRFMGRHGISAKHSGGMFFVSPQIQGLATWTRGKSRSSTFETLQHEGFHQFAYNYIGTRLPVWANEGLAQYFQDAIIVRGRMKTGLANSRRLALVQAALRKGRAIDTSVLLNTSHNKWNQTLESSPRRAQMLYAESWSIVFFLIHGDGGRYQHAFTRYLSLISDGHDSGQAFVQAFGLHGDLAPMARRWRAFVRHQKPDPFSAAASRLRFLGAALKYMHQHDAPTPHSMNALRKYLQARHFRLTRRSHGLSIEYRASNPDMFRYTPNDGSTAAFSLLNSRGSNLPPRLTAPGLTPTPTLVWSRNSDGKLVRDIRYR